MNPYSEFSLRASRLAVMIVSVMLLAGCATAKNPRDPFEGFNRAMFNFNETVDQAALKPVATAYQKTLPTFVQTGIGNFFGNLGDAWTAANNLLQGKFAEGLSDVTRVALNSSFGLLGILDIGSEAGLSKHKEDFGQTLGEWGVKAGPYIVLPLFGSSTLRDTLVIPLDLEADPWGYKDPVRWRNVGSAVRLIDRRASLLEASRLIDEAALDKYEFIRDAYLQRRMGQINDGDPVNPELYQRLKVKLDATGEGLHGLLNGLPLMQQFTRPKIPPVAKPTVTPSE